MTRRRIGLSLIAVPVLSAILFIAAPARPEETLPVGSLLHSPFGAALSDRLVADGFDRARVEAFLDDSRVQINATTLSYAIVYRETPADYSSFLSEERLSRARTFLNAGRTMLDATTAATGVPAEVIAAILMIESDFGNYRKLHTIGNVFLTLLWAERPENFDIVQTFVRKRVPDVTAEKVREKAGAKARWAYEQLGYLLRITEREKIDIFTLQGSWAGAFGMPQFIPSSYWSYAVDGNDDRRVDLFNEADAVSSVGNYLKTFGWRNDLPEEKRKAVIRRYNNSDLYAGTVLAVAERLRKPPEPTP